MKTLISVIALMAACNPAFADKSYGDRDFNEPVLTPKETKQFLDNAPELGARDYSKPQDSSTSDKSHDTSPNSQGSSDKTPPNKGTNYPMRRY